MDTFSTLADKMSEKSQFSDIDVFVQCSDLDCCIEDDICSNVRICDTDGDGEYDTIEGGSNNNDDGMKLNPMNIILIGFAMMLRALFI